MDGNSSRWAGSIEKFTSKIVYLHCWWRDTTSWLSQWKTSSIHYEAHERWKGVITSGASNKGDLRHIASPSCRMYNLFVRRFLPQAIINFCMKKHIKKHFMVFRKHYVKMILLVLRILHKLRATSYINIVEILIYIANSPKF